MLRELAPLLDDIEKLLAIAKLSHHVNAGVVLVDFVELDNVGMLQTLQDVNLKLKP